MFKIHEFKKRDPRLCSYLKVAVYHYVIMCTLNDIYYVNELCASIKTINQKKKNWDACFWAVICELVSSMECAGQLDEFS